MCGAAAFNLFVAVLFNLIPPRTLEGYSMCRTIKNIGLSIPPVGRCVLLIMYLQYYIVWVLVCDTQRFLPTRL